MINDIIIKMRSGAGLENSEREFLEYVIAQPSHPEYIDLYLAGIV